MKNTTNTLVTLSICMLFFTSCMRDTICIKGNGRQASQEFEVASFTEIQSNGSFDISISQGEQHIKAVGDENMLDELDIRVRNGVCIVEFKKGCHKNFDMSIEITVPNLEGIEVNGSGDIACTNFNNQNNLDLEISGSGDMRFEEFSGIQNLKMNIDGSGNIAFNKIISDIKTATIDISGSGNIKAFNCETDNVHVEINGSGDCKVYANKRLDVIIDGSGDVRYKGYPAIESNISGSGSIINSN